MLFRAYNRALHKQFNSSSLSGVILHLISSCVHPLVRSSSCKPLLSYKWERMLKVLSFVWSYIQVKPLCLLLADFRLDANLMWGWPPFCLAFFSFLFPFAPQAILEMLFSKSSSIRIFAAKRSCRSYESVNGVWLSMNPERLFLPIDLPNFLYHQPLLYIQYPSNE